MENKRIVEINGIKMEIDLSTARRIDEFKVGDNVKILKDKAIKSGVIVEFVNFRELPTIKIAIFRSDYWSQKIEFVYYNAESTEIEIVPACKSDLILEKDSIIEQMNKEITSKQNAVDELVAQKDWFIKFYGKYFAQESEG